MRVALVLSFVLGSAAAPCRAADIVVTAGTPDAFALPADPASPSPELVALLNATQNFDLIAGVNGGLPDRQVAHTFTGLPPGIVAATLTLRVRAGSDPGVSTDGVLISFADAASTSYCADAVVWARSFGPVPAGGCFPVADPSGLVGSWASGNDAEVELDLSALPLAAGGTVDVLPQMNALGFLDVNVSDETGCDFVRLSMDTTTVTAAPYVAGAPSLRAPSPNPFRTRTTFAFELPSPARVRLAIHDVAGRVVRDLSLGLRPAGAQAAAWDGRDDRGRPVPSGVYFCVLRGAGPASVTKAVRVE
jgi:hypothetical protein